MCRLTVREDAEEGGKTKEEGSERERERESGAAGGGKCEEEKGGHIVDNVLLHWAGECERLEVEGLVWEADEDGRTDG